MKNKIYPREGDRQTVYLKEVVSDPNIEVGEWTIYNDFAADPVDFERNNVLYHYPVNGDRLVIGKFCSLACGARFLFNSANHTLKSLSTYPFPIFWGEEWGIDKSEVASAWISTRMNLRLPPSALFMFSTAWAVVPEPAKESRTISLSVAIHFTILSSNKMLFSVSNPAYEPDKRMSIQLSLNSFPDCGGT